MRTQMRTKNAHKKCAQKTHTLTHTYRSMCRNTYTDKDTKYCIQQQQGSRCTAVHSSAQQRTQHTHNRRTNIHARKIKYQHESDY